MTLAVVNHTRKTKGAQSNCNLFFKFQSAPQKYLLGQGFFSHACCFRPATGQDLPQCLGAGFVQVRERIKRSKEVYFAARSVKNVRELAIDDDLSNNIYVNMMSFTSFLSK